MADEEEQQNPADTQVRHLVDDEMRTSYINYAMSVIIGRALPDVRDGLKPVHRRVLFGMHEAGHTPDRSYSKSARSVGEVMGKYHPHGDQSIYDTMVRMAQDFSLRYPLIDGQGNFGSIDGDPPAAMRYTESRLDRLASHMMQDINKDTVDFQPNFDDSENEPTVLPARLPNLLLNGSDGIAVGMATKIPPHNLTEVAAAIHLHVERIIEHGVDKRRPNTPPKITVAEYMEHLMGPDFPTGATIYGIDGITDMYETGHGRFHVRSQCEVLDDAEGKRIIITAIPYQVKKASMLEGIADLVSKETIKGIRDIRDESSKEGIRVVIEIKQNADPHAVLNQLYRSSRLQESYSANMMGIIDNQPVLLTLSNILHTYVRHRESVIQRRTQFELAKSEARAHVLEGLVKAHARIDDVVAAGKGSDSREHFEQILRGEVAFGRKKRFDFTAAQAKAIAERRLYQLSRIDTKKVEDEFSDLREAIAEYNAILASRERQLRILLEELDEMVARHGDERRTHIDPMPLSMDREDLVAERAIVISLSDDNYIRHLPVEAFRVQNRGGKGLKGVVTKDEDFPKSILTCFSKDRLLIFTNRMNDKGDMEGRVYGMKAWETPQASRHSRGSHIRNLLDRFGDEETIVTILPVSKEDLENTEGRFLIFATRDGRIKKSQLSEYARINRNGKKAINLREGDHLIAVRKADSDDHVVLVSKNGMACRFKPSDTRQVKDKETGEIRTYYNVKVQGRVSQGVRGMRLKEEDSVVGMVVSSNIDTSILTLTKYGMGKRSRLGTGEMMSTSGDEEEEGEVKQVRDGYRKTNRGAGGVRTMKLDVESADEIVSVRQVPDLDDQLFLLTASGMMIRIRAGQTKETSGKSTKGTRVMELRNKEKGGFIDEIIFSARLPAELIDEDDILVDVEDEAILGDDEE